MKEHLVTTLDKSNEMVLKILPGPPEKIFHKIPLEHKEISGFYIRRIVDAILGLPIRVGERVTVIVSPNEITEEHIIVSSLQRRLCECVEIEVVRHDGNRSQIPYLVSLRDDGRRSNELIDYKEYLYKR